MKITDVRTAVVEANYDWTFVRVYTDEGLVGLGESHGMSVPFWEDMVVGFDGPMIEDGHIKVSESPGLGVELNEEVAREYAHEGEPFFEEE